MSLAFMGLKWSNPTLIEMAYVLDQKIRGAGYLEPLRRA
jgi:hypothetical protein